MKIQTLLPSCIFQVLFWSVCLLSSQQSCFRRAYVFVSERELWKLCNKLFEIILIFSRNILIWNNEPRCFFSEGDQGKFRNRQHVHLSESQFWFFDWNEEGHANPTPMTTISHFSVPCKRSGDVFLSPSLFLIFRAFHCIHSWGCHAHIPPQSCSWASHDPGILQWIPSVLGRAEWPWAADIVKNSVYGQADPRHRGSPPESQVPVSLSHSKSGQHVTNRLGANGQKLTLPPMCPSWVFSFDPLHALFPGYTHLSVSGPLYWLSPLPKILINSVHESILGVSGTVLVGMN